MLNYITISKLDSLFVRNGFGDNKALALSLNANLMRLGYIMSERLFDAVKSMHAEDAEALYTDVIDILREIKGDYVYNPMYPNFPNQVMEASEVELYFNAIMHYWSAGEWKPNYDKLPRENVFEHSEFITLDLATEKDVADVFTRLLASNASISDADREIVEWYIDNYGNLVFPDTIPFKENMCYVVSLLLDRGKDITNVIKTATDVLRVVTSLSGGDVSLAENTRFRNFKRSERKKFLSILENVISEDDIQRHKSKWVKLFHGFHVGEYKNRFPKTAAIASKIRNGEKLDTVNSRIEQAILTKNIGSILSNLETRPGDFARRLDHILRENKKSRSLIIESFLSVADQVSTRVLMQLLGHFNGRKKGVDKRVVFPKGSVAKARMLRGELPKMSDDTVKSVRKGIKEVLLKRFSEDGELGKVYLDKSLKNCPLPMSQRSASKAMNTVARGTRIPFGNKGTLRFFIYWIGQDIDLSATYHDKDFNLIERVSYTNLRSSKFQACHSGDITYAPAPEGASEFIDVNIEKALNNKAKYVVMNVLVYSGPNFAEHEACSAGWMTREHVGSNEVYDPKFVDQKVDLTAESRNAIPVVFDLETREAVWCDLSTSRNTNWGGNNVESNQANIKEVLESIVNLENKPTIHQLFKLHAEARGEIVSSKKEADVVVSLNGDITPYDIDLINADYMK